MTTEENPKAAAMQDYHLVEGKWEAGPDLLAGLGDDGDIETHLKSLGWESYMSIGEADSYLWISSWQRVDTDGRFRYLVEINDPCYGSPLMLVDSLPELMDIFARWAPAVHAATVAGLIAELTSGGMSAHGLIETVAAKAKHGVGAGYEQLQREARERRARAHASKVKPAGIPAVRPTPEG